ncbi:protein kinase [Corynebacterium felinum]|uniref:non-specific serine/threonine protein kinase n=1 Tax=Corynebacterium felinum TaxID=131318 RepID=A0ABU2B6R8_9CORY|nr:serine/threonine-protein kinase [Corynebacterium felinum]MDF5819560.1 protein kinase [Corynebacterium felinum]MDR7354312.1 serine/threonine-protein kinase [Corynebacterium felinum]WJY93689.1 Serine/threonine-protein kinase PknA [Corynebacterium felinum]
MEHIQSLIGPDYQLQWVVGTGGMSTVYLADDVRNQREVAVKVLRPEFSDNVEFLSRFRNEALASEDIISRNVVRTYDYRELVDPASGRNLCFIVMEFVRGESLADLIARRGMIPEEEALDILEQAAHGLRRIHELGLVHRDIKPGNILITQNGTVKITDFGIAKAASSVPLTRTGMVVGTAQYVSPEQAQGLDVTFATDVYSLGVVGYELLTGKRPFSGDSSVSVAIAHINNAPPALPTSISAPTRELIGIALRKDPTHRYGDGAELEKAISAARLGKRPPQPSGAARVVPAEASPTAVTAVASAVTGTSSASAPAVHPRTPNRPIPQSQIVEPKRSSSGFLVGFLIAVVVAFALAAGTVLYLNSQSFQPEPSVPPAPETVTITPETTPEPIPTITMTVEPTTSAPPVITTSEAEPTLPPISSVIVEPSEVIVPTSEPEPVPTVTLEPTDPTTNPGASQ